jgi:hypothetical protein
MQNGRYEVPAIFSCCEPHPDVDSRDPVPALKIQLTLKPQTHVGTFYTLLFSHRNFGSSYRKNEEKRDENM